jgi:hypothetical protein
MKRYYILIVAFICLGMGIVNAQTTTIATSINAFPNPSNGGFTVSIRNSESGVRDYIEVYNSAGEKLFSQLSFPIAAGMNFQLYVNLTNQPGGVYLYRVLTESRNLVGEGKMVIQK